MKFGIYLITWLLQLFECQDVALDGIGQVQEKVISGPKCTVYGSPRPGASGPLAGRALRCPGWPHQHVAEAAGPRMGCFLLCWSEPGCGPADAALPGSWLSADGIALAMLHTCYPKPASELSAFQRASTIGGQVFSCLFHNPSSHLGPYRGLPVHPSAPVSLSAAGVGLPSSWLLPLFSSILLLNHIFKFLFWTAKTLEGPTPPLL